jgi:hypothetical protein
MWGVLSRLDKAPRGKTTLSRRPRLLAKDYYCSEPSICTAWVCAVPSGRGTRFNIQNQTDMPRDMKRGEEGTWDEKQSICHTQVFTSTNLYQLFEWNSRAHRERPSATSVCPSVRRLYSANNEEKSTKLDVLVGQLWSVWNGYNVISYRQEINCASYQVKMRHRIVDHKYFRGQRVYNVFKELFLGIANNEWNTGKTIFGLQAISMRNTR